MTTETLSRILHTRGAAVAIVAIAAVTVAVTAACGGIGGEWLTLVGAPAALRRLAIDIGWSLAANVAALCGIMLLMQYVNRRYNVLRTMTALFIGVFAVMQVATPTLALRLNVGTMLAAVVMVAVLLLYRTYGDPRAQRSVFLIFFIMALSALLTRFYGFVVYGLLFVVGCVQMRIFNARSVVALLLGVITAGVLYFSMGYVAGDAALQFSFEAYGSIFAADDLSETLVVLLTAALTALVAVVALTANIFKTIAYNARSRAYSGFLVVAVLFTIVVMAVDYSHFVTYMPMLNCFAAFQVAHFFAIHRRDKSCLGVIGIVVAYLMICVWRVVEI